MKSKSSEADEPVVAGSLVLTKGLRVLNHVAYCGGTVGVRELARETQLPVAVVHPCQYKLQQPQVLLLFYHAKKVFRMQVIQVSVK